jgi:hypothetical protein
MKLARKHKNHARLACAANGKVANRYHGARQFNPAQQANQVKPHMGMKRRRISWG